MLDNIREPSDLRRHAAADLSELARDRLREASHDDFAIREERDSGLLERRSGGRHVAVGHEEVGGAPPIDDPGSSPFDAHARGPERLAHAGQRSRPMVQQNR